MPSLTTTPGCNARLRNRVMETIRVHGPISRERIVLMCVKFVPPETASRYAASSNQKAPATPLAGARRKLSKVIIDLRRAGHISSNATHKKDGPIYTIAVTS